MKSTPGQIFENKTPLPSIYKKPYKTLLNLGVFFNKTTLKLFPAIFLSFGHHKMRVQN
jgi:hypothetical protein